MMTDSSLSSWLMQWTGPAPIPTVPRALLHISIYSLHTHISPHPLMSQCISLRFSTAVPFWLIGKETFSFSTCQSKNDNLLAWPIMTCGKWIFHWRYNMKHIFQSGCSRRNNWPLVYNQKWRAAFAPATCKQLHCFSSKCLGCLGRGTGE